MAKTYPLVSVGLPTCNRSASLERAIESVLAQDYPNFELIISDNASTDGTRFLCEAHSRRDARLCYVRQPANRGPGPNFAEVLNRSRGGLFMWLADDDWMGPGLLSAAARFLLDNPEYVIAGGRGTYFRGDALLYEEPVITLDSPKPAERVLAYYRQVGLNTLFYGLMRRELLRQVSVPQCLGADWFFVAAAAFIGKIKTLEAVTLCRDLGGGSEDVERLALGMGMSKLRAKNAHLLIAATAFADIAWRSPVYSSSGLAARLALGASAGTIVARRFYLPKVLPAIRARIKLRTRLREGRDLLLSRKH